MPGLKRDAAGNYLEPIGRNRDPLKVFAVETVDDRPAIHVSGQGFGVITTAGVFADFHLRLQVKWGEKKWGAKLNAPRDCGLLYFCHGEPGFDHETWPRSIEFQIQEHDMGDLFALDAQITVPARPEGRLWRYDPTGAPTLFVQKSPVGNRCVKLLDAEKPKGEWNTLELICLGGDSLHLVNGKVVLRAGLNRRPSAAKHGAMNTTSSVCHSPGRTADVYERQMLLVDGGRLAVDVGRVLPRIEDLLFIEAHEIDPAVSPALARAFDLRGRAEFQVELNVAKRGLRALVARLRVGDNDHRAVLDFLAGLARPHRFPRVEIAAVKENQGVGRTDASGRSDHGWPRVPLFRGLRVAAIRRRRRRRGTTALRATGGSKGA